MSKRILISAYSCSPYKGSEPSVGWNWVKYLSAEYEIWCITRKLNKSAIERWLAENDFSLLTHFIYVDFPFCRRVFPENTTGERLYYVLWHILEFFVICVLSKKVEFDLLHHLTWNSFKFPGFLWLLRNRFAWGPLGGGELIPAEFEKFLGWRGRLFERSRELLTIRARDSVLVKSALKKASLVFVANESTERQLPIHSSVHFIRELETAVVWNDHIECIDYRKKDVIEILWIGVMVARKGLPILLTALSRLTKKISFHLTVVGDGPQKSRWASLARDLDLEGAVDFVGWVRHEEVEAYYRGSDIFVFTSLRDTSGNVILEAMTYGLPIVAFHHHGVSEILTDETAMLIPVTTPDSVIRNMGSAILELTSDVELRRKIGTNARKRASSVLTWEAKFNRIKTAYDSVFD